MSDLDLGTLQGTMEMDDHLTPVFDLSSISVEQFNELFDKTGHTVLEGAESFGIAELAVEGLKEAVELGVETLKDLTVEGAKIGNVEAAFDTLTEGAGRLSETLLGSLKSGTQGTVTDFDLMKIANKDLTAGLALTDQQFQTLATAGFALAKKSGGDVKDVLEDVNNAMLTGRTRSLSLLIGRVDLTKAEGDYAASIGGTRSELTAEQKLYADRIGIMDQLQTATARLGTQTKTLDTSVKEVEVSWANWYEDLAKSIGTSPAVVNAFNTIEEAIQKAFGGDAQTVREMIISWVNNLANAVSQYGPIVINWIVNAKNWLENLYSTVISQWDALPTWLKTVTERTGLATVGLVAIDQAVGAASGGFSNLTSAASDLTSVLGGIPKAVETIKGGFSELSVLWAALDFSSVADLGASISLIGGGIVAAIGPLGLFVAGFAALAAATELGKWTPVSEFFESIGLQIGGMSAAEAEAAISSRDLSNALNDQATKTAAASKAAEDAKAKSEALAKALADEAEARREAAIEAHNKQVIDEAERDQLRMTEEQTKALNDAIKEVNSSQMSWKSTMAELDPLLVHTVEQYIQAGVSLKALGLVYDLTDAQLKAMTLDIKDQTKELAAHTKQAESDAAMDAQLNDLRAQGSGTTTQKLIADIKAWSDAQIASHIKAKTDTADFYDDLEQMDILKFKHAEQRMIDADNTSNTYYENLANEAEAAYDRAMRHSDQYSDDAIANFKKQADAARQVADNIENGVTSALELANQQLTKLSADWELFEDGTRVQTSSTTTVDQFTIDSTKGGADALIDQLLKGPPDPKMVTSFATQAEYGSELAYYNALRALYPTLKQEAKQNHPNLPSFSDGGVGDFGDGTLAMLHGQEAIIPLDKMGSGITNNFYVNGTGAQVAQQAAEYIMMSLKQGRQFGSA